MYRHTQTGWFIIIPLVVILILLSYLYFQIYGLEIIWFVRAIIIVLALCLLLFYNLTVIVEGGNLEVRFGTGLIKKRIKLSDIENCERVKNRVLDGWGIRYIPGSGLMFNVSGLHAVQLTIKDGKHFRVGTDEPDKLIEAIKHSKG